MGNFFPRWTNFLPLVIAAFLVLIGAGIVGAVSYYFTPKYTRVGYQPSQPVPFDHSLHAGQLGMDCRYCHSNVEDSSHSNVPTAETCMNCHSVVKKDSPKLAPIRRAFETGEPVLWEKLHAVPDYAYFNHAVHVNRGVSCVSCHGKINEMEVVHHAEPLSMGWCLDCHRNPEEHLRPLDEITNLDWEPPTVGEDPEDRDAALAALATERNKFYSHLSETSGVSYSDMVVAIEKLDKVKPSGADSLDSLVDLAVNKFGEEAMTQEEIGIQLKSAWKVVPPVSCTACHR